VKLARQKLSIYYAEVTPSTRMLLISAHILDPFRKFRLFWLWAKGIDINPEDVTSYTTQSQQAGLKYVENEYCAKDRPVPVKKRENLPRCNLNPSETVSGSCQSCFDPYDLCRDDEEYLTPKNMAETTPGQSDLATCILTAARLYSNSPPEAPKNWGQNHPDPYDYNSDPMEISSTFWSPDISDWWCQQEETHSKYADLSDMVHDIFCIIPHGVGVEASFSIGRDLIGWRQSKTTGETLCEKVAVSQFAQADTGILSGTDPELDTMNTENDTEMKKEAEEKTLHRIA